MIAQMHSSTPLRPDSGESMAGLPALIPLMHPSGFEWLEPIHGLHSRHRAGAPPFGGQGFASTGRCCAEHYLLWAVAELLSGSCIQYGHPD